MTTVEDFEVIAAIGRDEFDDLKTKVRGTPAGKDLILIGLIQKAVVWLTVAKAANETGVSFTDKGLFFESLQASSGGSLKEEVVKDFRLKKVIDDCTRNGKAYLQNVIDYLVNNVDDFPLFKASDLYNDEETTHIDTTTNKKIIVR